MVHTERTLCVLYSIATAGYAMAAYLAYAVAPLTAGILALLALFAFALGMQHPYRKVQA